MRSLAWAKGGQTQPSCPSKTYLGSNKRLLSLLAKDTRWEARAVAVSLTVSPHGENVPLFFLLDTDHRLNSPHGVSRVVSNSIKVTTGYPVIQILSELSAPFPANWGLLLVMYHETACYSRFCL